MARCYSLSSSPHAGDRPTITVKRIDGTARDVAAGREVWVEFTPGLDAGLRQGAVLAVYRKEGESAKYLGTVTTDFGDAVLTSARND